MPLPVTIAPSFDPPPAATNARPSLAGGTPACTIRQPGRCHRAGTASLTVASRRAQASRVTSARRFDDPSREPARRSPQVQRPREEASGPAATIARLQRLAGNAAVSGLAEEDRASPVLDIVGRGGGRPLEGAVRSDMEDKLGAGFGDVRVHTDPAAAASARAVDARAYTVGSEIVFDEGVYHPGSEQGRHTLAHELTHVIQQRSGPVDGSPTGDGIRVSDPSDRFEQEADRRASGIGDAGATHGGGAAGAVQRDAARHGDDEDVQTLSAQRAAGEEEEPEVQSLSAQRDAAPEEDEQKDEGA